MAKSKKDFGQLASQIIEKVGGKDNIVHAAHCMTRLRVTTKDTGLVDIDEIKKLGVIGAQMVGDQLQVIIGNDVPDVYEEFLKQTGLTREAVIDENLDADLTKQKRTIKDILGSILPTIVSCVFPILPALCACGMLQALVMILVKLRILSAGSPTVATLTWVYNVAFYYLPVLVATASAKRFHVKTAMAVLMACIMIAPDFIALVAAGQGTTIPNPAGPPTVIPGTGNAGYIFGLPIYPATYSNTILPIILCVAIMGILEKYLNKWIPKAFRFVFVPLIELLIMLPVGLAIVGPIGAKLSIIMANVLTAMFRTLGPVAPTLLTIFMPFIIMTGLHFNLMAVAMSMAAVMSKNVVTHPAFFLTQAAQGAACLAVALKTKDADRRALGFSSAFSDWVPGISEPGMYGITLKYKTPMIASMIGSGIGAFIGGLMNVGSYAGGPPNLFTLSLFINPENGSAVDLKNIVICMIIACIITFIITWFIYKDEKADEIDLKG